MNDVENKEESNLDDNQNVENKETKIITDENKDTNDEELEEELEDEKLPFPNARVVRLMRESLDPHKQIKSIVKKEMNLWLGRLVKVVCKKMNAFNYSYVDYGMFKQAIETFENIQTIELEKMRIIKSLEKIKADCDVIVNEVEIKFHD